MDKVEMLVDNINGGRNDNFKTAKITSLSYSDGDWTFSMEVSLK